MDEQGVSLFTCWHGDASLQITPHPTNTRAAVCTSNNSEVGTMPRISAPTAARLIVKPNGSVDRVAFSPDGTRLVTASRDRTARLYPALWGPDDDRTVARHPRADLRGMPEVFARAALSTLMASVMQRRLRGL
jgi:WD40 repeat protein